MKTVLVGPCLLLFKFQWILQRPLRSRWDLQSLLLQTEGNDGTLTIHGQIGDLLASHSMTNLRSDIANAAESE